MSNKLWDELTLDEKHSKILKAKKELDTLLDQYNSVQVNYINAIKSVVLNNYNADADLEKNVYLNGVGMGYVTKAGYFRKYKNDGTSDFEPNLGVYGDDCPVTLSKNSLSTYNIISSGNSDIATAEKEGKPEITIKYNKNNNKIKEGQNCKLNYYENIFVYNVDESKYSSYEGCLKPNLDATTSTDNSIMFHEDANSYDDCINATTVNAHKYFSLKKNSDNDLDCISYKDYPDMGLPTTDTINYDSDGNPKRSISEQTITLFDNSESAFKNTTNLFKKGYKSSVFGVFTTNPETITQFASEGNHCFLKLARNGNLKMYKIGNTGKTLENKSLEFFNIHLGNIKDSNNKKFLTLGDCDEDIGGYLDETSINVEWGKECKAAGCFIYQDKGCTN